MTITLLVAQSRTVQAGFVQMITDGDRADPGRVAEVSRPLAGHQCLSSVPSVTSRKPMRLLRKSSPLLSPGTSSISPLPAEARYWPGAISESIAKPASPFRSRIAPPDGELGHRKTDRTVRREVLDAASVIGG